MAKTSETLLVEIGADIKNLQTGLKESTKEIDKFSGVATKLGGVLAGVFAVDKIKDFVLMTSQMAAEAEGVEAAFARIGGGGVLDDLRASTKGTVSDLELMKRAVQARNFDIPLKDLSSLFEFATKRAQETGESVDYLVNSIVLGIGRKSPLILDNLGISAVRLRKELKGVGSEVSTVSDIAAAVGRIANTEMAKAGGIIETTAIKTAAWGATWDNIGVSIGNATNRLLNEFAPAIDSLLPKIQDIAAALFDGRQSFIDESVLSEMQGFNDMLDSEKAQQIKEYANEIETLTKGIKTYKDRLTEIEETPWYDSTSDLMDEKAAIEGVVEADEKRLEIITQVSEKINKVVPEEVKKVTELKETWGDFINRLSDLGNIDVESALDPLTSFQIEQEIFKDVNDSLRYTGEVMEELEPIIQKSAIGMEDMAKNTKAVDKAIKDLGTGADKIKPIMQTLVGGAESFGFALGEMAMSGERNLKRLIQQILNMASALLLANSAKLGVWGLIGGLAGVGVLQGVASTISNDKTYIEGDKLRVVTENADSQNSRRF